MNRKLGGGVPFSGVSWVPIEHKLAWAEAYLHTKWHLSPSSRLVATGGVGNLSESAAVHRLRHRRRRHRKQVRSSPFSRKYYGRRLRRTADECGGRRVDAVDVERTAAIMKAFYCWNDDVAALTNQLRLVARGNLLAVTSSGTCWR